MYKETDKYITKLKKVLTREYKRLSLMSFDQLNVIRVRKETKALYRRIDEMNRKAFKKIAKYSEDYLIDAYLADLEMDDKPDPAKVVDKLLKSYNTVTGYVYDNEWERKRLRMVEEMMTAITLQDRPRFTKVVKKSADLMFTQSSQYAQDVVDAMMTELYEDAGAPEVIWCTEKDDKVCEVCRERDGVHYRIDLIPPKPHYNCRCWWKPVMRS